MSDESFEPTFTPTPDVSDQATQLEMESLEIALRENARKVKPAQLPQPDGTYAIYECVECGNDIGEGRLKAAIRNDLCIECATALERRRR